MNPFKDRQPLVYVIDFNGIRRPLCFGESILDSLGTFHEHETMVSMKYDDDLITKDKKKGITIYNNDDVSSCSLGHRSAVEKHLIVPTRAFKQQLIEKHQYPTTSTDKSYNNHITDTIKDCKSNHNLFVSILNNNATETIKYPQVASVMILKDCNNNVLLTRRPEYLRTFSNCWVFPGGKMDSNETLIDTAKRELFEETGIDINKYKYTHNGQNEFEIKMVALWESVFPDIGFINNNNNNNNINTINSNSNNNNIENSIIDNVVDCDKHRYPPTLKEQVIIKYHTIVAFFECKLLNKSFENIFKDECNYKLCKTEVDCCLWLDAKELKLLKTMSPNGNTYKYIGINNRNENIKIDWRCLYGIYPNQIGQGIGRGHAYALSKL